MITNPSYSEPNNGQSEVSLENLFDDFFKQRPVSHQKIDKGRLEELAAFEQAHFKEFYQTNVLQEIRQVLNGRLSALGKRIEAPHGPATLYFDYVDSTDSNGMTFTVDGKYFVGITSTMLLDFDKASVAIAGRAAVRHLLGMSSDVTTIWGLITAFLSLQLQFIVFHELGHIFHDHAGARTFRTEYKLTENEKLLFIFPNQDAEQAKEWLADRHAIRMLLTDLIGTDMGANLKRMTQASLSADECILWLIVLAIGATFFFGPRERFHLPLVRKRSHPFALARLNVIMRSIVEWAEANNREDIRVWASDTENFEWATSCIREAAGDEDRAQEWIAQGEFLRSDEGREYLDVIYKEDGVITPAAEQRWWKLT